jgi:hypothetical protein
MAMGGAQELAILLVGLLDGPDVGESLLFAAGAAGRRAPGGDLRIAKEQVRQA